MQIISANNSAVKNFAKTLVLVLPGILVILLLLSGVWNYIVKTHLKQVGTALPAAALEATQEALKEKAAYKASEYRTKRLYGEAQNRYQLEKLRLRRNMLPKYSALRFYTLLGFISAIGLSALMLAAGCAGAKLKEASVCHARIGKHSQIPVRFKDLAHFYPIAANLSVAEIEASLGSSHEQAYKISRTMLEDMTRYSRLFVGQGSPGKSRLLEEHPTINTRGTTPDFAELLRSGLAAPGNDLVLGYTRSGEPQHGTLQELKTLAVAGLQGSGKSFSTAYLIASGVLATGCRAYVIDPHKQHPESLSSLIQPLEQSGYVSAINPFDTPTLIRNLNQTLDRRLNGEEASAPPILLVIDELARLATMDCFDELLAFLERCTEEIRKANIIFIGSSHKWTARHFKGRADIRRCMNSMLIHKTKPSQANLLLEDTADKNLVKQIQAPGEAILVTDYGEPTLVTIPRCSQKDMQQVAELLRQNSPGNLASFSQSGLDLTRHTPDLSHTITALRRTATQA